MKKISILILTSVLALHGGYVHPFEVSTHRELSQRAVRSSNVDNFLQAQLNVLRGIENNIFNGNMVIEWIEDGSEREDDSGRFFNHFHNPLRR